MERKNFDYDGLTDSLFISVKKENEKVQGSAEIGNLIIDFTSDGRIVSVEFLRISKFLEMMNVNPVILEQLTEVNLIMQKQKGAISIFAILKTPEKEQPLPLATIPIARALTPSM